jgi:hypothetical protein
MDRREMGWEGVDWLHDLGNTLMNLGFHKGEIS